MPLDMDLSDIDMNEAEAAVASKGLVAEGYHHAVLEGVREGTANTGTPFREFTFRILAGPFKGETVEHTLYLPHDGQAEDKKKKSKQHAAIYYHRLGVHKKVTVDGKAKLAPVEGKSDFCDVLGATCIIDVRHEIESWTDKKTGQPRSMPKAKLQYEGVLGLDDPRVKEKKVPLASGSEVAAAAASGQAGAAAKPKDNFSDL